MIYNVIIIIYSAYIQLYLQYKWQEELHWSSDWSVMYLIQIATFSSDGSFVGFCAISANLKINTLVLQVFAAQTMGM